MPYVQKKVRSTVDSFIKELKKDNKYEESAEEYENIGNDIGKIRYVEELIHNYEKRLRLHCGVKLKIEKSDLKSLHHRMEGNTLYKQRKYEEALNEFNKSICFAVKGSGSAAVGYNNRSAVLFDMGLYNECLANIHLARQTGGLPESLLSKIQSREEMSTAYVEASEISEQSGPTLNVNEHPLVKNVASCLELTEDESRLWVSTTKALKVGDIIALEKPFTFVVQTDNIYKRCHNCLSKSALYTAIPCPNCNTTVFCNQKCLQEAFERFHKYECPVSDALEHTCGIVERFAVRMFLETLYAFRNTGTLTVFTENSSNYNKNYFNINWDQFSSQEHYSSIFNEIPHNFGGLFHVTAIVILIRDYIMLKYTSLKDVLVTEAEKDLFSSLVLRNLTTFIRDPICIKEDCKNEFLGTSISAFGALVRPGRFPNVRAVWQDGYIVYKVIRDVRAYSRLLKDHPNPSEDKDDHSAYYWSLDMFALFAEGMFVNFLHLTAQEH